MTLPSKIRENRLSSTGPSFAGFRLIGCHLPPGAAGLPIHRLLNIPLAQRGFKKNFSFCILHRISGKEKGRAPGST
jgi:hypothetical protein